MDDDSAENLEELEVTRIDNVFVCNNCGASVIHKLKNLKHYIGCTSGESKKWEKYYGQSEISLSDDEYEKYLQGCS